MDKLIHVTTVNSLRAGIVDDGPCECMVCGNETLYMDWCGARCDTCGADTAWEGDYAGFVRSIRKFCGLTRKEVAEA